MSIINCPAISTVQRTRGATLFALDVKVCIRSFTYLYYTYYVNNITIHYFPTTLNQNTY